VSEIDPQQFGQMRAEVTHLRESVEKLESAVDKLTDALSELRGGKKLVVMLGLVIGSLAGGISWIASHIKFSP
jgi:hypothetical protein